MDVEKLETANELFKTIKVLKEQKERYNDAKSIDEIKFVKSDNYYESKIQTRFIDFEVLKTLAIQKINKELEELENKFNAL